MSAAPLALAKGISLTFKSKRRTYLHRWGEKMADAKLVVCTWKVSLLDLNDIPFQVTFDIVDSDEPLVIGDNILKYSDHIRLSPFAEADPED